MASIVYSGAARREGETNGLFNGITFWLSKQVPSRDRYVNNIMENGGRLTINEREADMRIHDHARKTNPAETYSYTFIEQSIRDGVLANKDQHRAGQPKRAVRQPGDPTQPTKQGRAPFNTEEDCILWDWMTKHLEAGGTDGGNKIYQLIAEEYPRHTFQSWRSRWLDRLKNRQRPAPETQIPTAETQQPAPASPVPAAPASTARTAPPSTGFQVPPRLPTRKQDRAEASVAPQTTATTSNPRAAQSPSRAPTGQPGNEHTQATDQEIAHESAQNTVEYETAAQTMHPSIETTDREERQDHALGAAQNTASDNDQRSASVASQNNSLEGIEVDPLSEVKLWRAAATISDLSQEELEDAWEIWANQEENRKHSAENWRWIWENYVQPEWIKGLLKAHEYAEQRSRTTPEPLSNTVSRTRVERAADKPEVPESPSQRAKANSSKRLVPNSQSTGSQPATQDSDPGPQKKRKLQQDAESLSSTLTRKKRSIDNSHSTLADRQDDGQWPVDQEELLSEDEVMLDRSQASSSLTGPDTPATRRQRKVDDQLLSEVKPDTQNEIDLRDVADDPTSDEEDEEDDDFQTQQIPSAARAAVARVETPAARLHSSYSSTTTPGNTARQHVVSPTPKRRHQQPSSSLFSTTTPGNTAAPPVTQPHPQSEASQDSEMERIAEYLDEKVRQGFDRRQASEFLDAASHVQAIADRALRYMRRNKGKMPANLSGFWTGQDDEDLRSEDEDLRAAMQTKHGAEGCAQREAWLQMYKDDFTEDGEDD